MSMLRITQDEIAAMYDRAKRTVRNPHADADGKREAQLVLKLLYEHALLCEVADAAAALDRWGRTDRIDAALEALGEDLKGR
jgi:hypothetical protein